MEFEYLNFNGRLVLNPSDFILRFENKENLRVYEKTYFEHDFADYLPLGGIDFAGRALSWCFSNDKKNPDLEISNFTNTASQVMFLLTYKNPLLSNPIQFGFKIPAVRKENGGADIEDMNRRMKAMGDTLDKRMRQLETTLSVVESLKSKTQELEERCGAHVVIPSCDYAIPADTISLKLVRINTADMGNWWYSSFPNMGFQRSCGCGGHGNMSGNNPFKSPHCNCNMQVNYETNAYTFTTLRKLNNLKYLKYCTHLVLGGVSDVQDFSPIGEMKNLRNLTICSSRNFDRNNNQNINAGNNPVLRDISWIRNLKNLTDISFVGCSQLTDISPLKDLPNLTNLDIRETGVKNTEFLVNGRLTIKK